MKHALYIIAGVWAVGLAVTWIWIHAATQSDDEGDEIADWFDYADLEDGDG